MQAEAERAKPGGPGGPVTGELHLSFLDHMPLTQSAVAFARRRHGDQKRRADGASVILHLLEVASALERAGYGDAIVAAAVLHDVLENTGAERSELESTFGSSVATLVETVSDDPAIRSLEARKRDTCERVRRAGVEAQVVYAADKVSKTRELRWLVARDPADPEIGVRTGWYRHALEMLEEQIPQSRLVEALRFELEALEELPPEQT